MRENKTPVTCGLAIASIVVSLLFFIPLLGIAGLVMGIMALIKISKSNGKLIGQGLAIAGIIIGAIRAFLLILVVIAILISLPEMKEAFNRGRHEAMSSEARGNLQSICNLEEAYKNQHGTYINCPQNPSQISSNGSGRWQMSMAGWKDINFNPAGNMYYQYEVINATKNSFTAIAVGDLDQDKIYSKYTITQEGNISVENEYE